MSKAYKNPSAKIIISPIRWRSGSFRDLMIGIGTVRITRSERMLKEALKNQENFLLIQRIFLVGDQNADTGIHASGWERAHQQATWTRLF